jgi:dinuclear metal center YbgI/SA1388 family protein
MGRSLAELVTYLDGYLRVADVPDSPQALNGLQVENGGSVSRVAAAVDACQVTIDAAAAAGADLLVVHHGLFWDGNKPTTGRRWRRLAALVRADLAVYSAHIPLDLHPEVGNNAVLARLIGIEETEPFGESDGVPVGLAGALEIDRSELIARVAGALGADPHVIPAGPDRIRRMGVITGGAGNMIGQAIDAGLDAFVTGEGAHHTHFDAEEGGINVLYGGHYATETFGVKALATHIEEKFGIPWSFVNHPTGL